MQLSKQDRQALEKSGITESSIVVIRRDARGEMDRLIQGQNETGEIFYGWWLYGESAEDIRWADGI